MIFRNNKRAITWLLVVAILHLMLNAFGNAVMASPQMESKSIHIQSTQQVCLDCKHQPQHALDLAVTECGDCQEKTCLFSCSVCVQASLFIRTHPLSSRPGSGDFFHHISHKLTSLGYKPTPRPPKQHHS